MKIVCFVLLAVSIFISDAGAVEGLPRAIGSVQLGMTIGMFTKDISAKVEDCLGECREEERYSEIKGNALYKAVGDKSYEVMEVFFWKNMIYFMIFTRQASHVESVTELIAKLGGNYKLTRSPQGLLCYAWDDGKTLLRTDVNPKSGTILTYSLKDLTVNTKGAQW